MKITFSQEEVEEMLIEAARTTVTVPAGHEVKVSNLYALPYEVVIEIAESEKEEEKKEDVKDGE